MVEAFRRYREACDVAQVFGDEVPPPPPVIVKARSSSNRGAYRNRIINPHDQPCGLCGKMRNAWSHQCRKADLTRPASAASVESAAESRKRPRQVETVIRSLGKAHEARRRLGLHASHDLKTTNALIFCGRCGAHTFGDKPRLLKASCEQPTQLGSINLARFLNNKPPQGYHGWPGMRDRASRNLVELPVPKASAKAPAAGVSKKPAAAKRRG